MNEDMKAMCKKIREEGRKERRERGREGGKDERRKKGRKKWREGGREEREVLKAFKTYRIQIINKTFTLLIQVKKTENIKKIIFMQYQSISQIFKDTRIPRSENATPNTSLLPGW